MAKFKPVAAWEAFGAFLNATSANNIAKLVRPCSTVFPNNPRETAIKSSIND